MNIQKKITSLKTPYFRRFLLFLVSFVFMVLFSVGVHTRKAAVLAAFFYI